jgi:hypothetical protein
MRYLLSARMRPGKEADLLRSLTDGSFGRGFPYGDLGDVLRESRVDSSGTLRWVEVCYCREYYGVAMEEELPYFEEYLAEMTIADARNPRGCKGYPDCGDCDCTRKLRPEGEDLLSYLRRRVEETSASSSRFPPETATEEKPARSALWLGWRGRVTEEEERRNLAAGCYSGGPGQRD